MTVAPDMLLSDTGAIARRLPGFEVRPQQLAMAAAVERAFEDRQRLFVEAGTGVGKSFAYLLPAIRRVVERGERVVIATNTISLQEQLIEKDIPLLNAVIPEEFSAVLVKGRRNYIGLRRLQRQRLLQGCEPLLGTLLHRRRVALLVHRLASAALAVAAGAATGEGSAAVISSRCRFTGWSGPSIWPEATRKASG